MLAPGGFDATMEKWGAQYLREMLPQSDYWPVMPPERVHDRILGFGRAQR